MSVRASLAFIAALSCLGLPGPTLAASSQPGFTATDMAEAARHGAGNKELANTREVVAETETLRAAFVLDPHSAWVLLSSDERVALEVGIGPETSRQESQIVWFMRSASVRASGEDLTGLYNPLADVWLLFRWSRIGGAPRFDEVTLVPGAVLRPIDEREPWTAGAGLYAQAFADANARAMERFAMLSQVTNSEQLFTLIADDSAPLRSQAFAQIDQWLAGLEPWVNDDDKRRAWASLRQGLMDTKSDNTGQMQALPERVRASLAPAGAISRDGGISLLLVSPLYPEIWVTADYSNATASGSPRLGTLSLAAGRADDAPRVTSPAPAAAPFAAPSLAVLPLEAVAGAARYRLSASSELLLRGLDPGSRDVFAALLQTEGDTNVSALWSRLVAGAVQVRREAAKTADTLWFNPLFDAGIVVRWTRDETGAWTAAAAAPVLGETIRGETYAGRAPTAVGWIARGGSMSEALTADATRSFVAADNGSWNRLFLAGPEMALPVLSRLLRGSRALQEMVASPGYEESLSLVHRLLVADDPRLHRLPAEMRNGLADFGEAARLTLRPVTAVRRADGWSVALQSPDAPAITWLVHFTDPAVGQPAVATAFNVVGVGGVRSETRP